MKYNLKDDYDFSGANLVTPDTIMVDICDELNKSTYEIVLGNVSEYSGSIDSYNQLSAFEAIAKSVNATTKVDVQDKLGSIGERAYSQYEWYLSAKYIDNYKYRILFIAYSIGGYPVKVVLEQGIADELNGEEDSNYVFDLDTKEEFEGLILSVLQTDKVQGIIQELITASLRKFKTKIQNGEED